MDYIFKIKSRKRKPNVKHIILIIIIFIAIILLITFTILGIKLKNSSNKNIVVANDIANVNDTDNENAIVVDTSEETKKNENNYNYSTLDNTELERFDKIYSTSEPKRVFLTFDDGPTKQVTPFILDLLKSENIKATFFVLGTRVDSNPELVKREYDEGHFVANHGYTHNYSSIYSSSSAVIDEYYKTNESIRKAINNPNYNSLVFRFPGGSVGGTYDSLKKGTKQILRTHGIASVDWNALTGDSEGIKTKEKLLERFYNTVTNKSSVVLLMHDAADKILTYEILPQIISYFRENGFEFKTMYDVILRDS